ncbi:DNA cytosine methyltransferase [Microbacterium sp. YY-01]|uniref:DNA cytosine methyltransferase n=1 Tax=Microbacterium sp. YY-01 TaxID=3421634 RepID=UPI003D1797D7
MRKSLDVRSSNELTVGSLFSGYGGLDLAVEAFFGARTIWHCEFEPAPSRVLAERWPGVPNLGDVTQIDWSQVERPDIIAGGSPCQDLSAAGRRAGMSEGTRSNLWVAMREAIAVLRPQFVVWENVRGAYSATAVSDADSEMEQSEGLLGDNTGRPSLRALGRVLGDLSDLGFDAEWRGVRASDVGAPHGRFRVFVLATRQETVADTDSERRYGGAKDIEKSKFAPQLRDIAKLLPTPRATDHNDSLTAPSARRHVEAGNGTLTETIGYALLPTPDASLGTRGGAQNPDKRRAGGHSVSVADVVTHLLPTPKAGDADFGMPRTSGRPPEKSTHLVTRLVYTKPATDWGEYEPAIRQWEQLLGREAPEPVEIGPQGGKRVTAQFVEWMMGLDEGWVTSIDVSWRAQLRMLGNGVVSQQALQALKLMR